MLEIEFLIYDRRAGKRHVQIALGFGLLLLLASLAILRCRTEPLHRLDAFIPVIDTMHLLFCCIIATVLLSLASVLRAKALIALGTGYVFVGFIAFAHALTYPDTFTHTGLFGAHNDTVTRLYLIWHTSLPVAIIVYALLKDGPHPHMPARLPVRTILLCLAGAAVAAVAATWFATTGKPLQLGDVITGTTYVDFWHYLVMVLSAATIVLLWRGRRSVLDLCLMLVLWAWLLEYVLILPGAARFSVGWYAGRVLGLVSGLFVLLMLLIEMSRLYARTVMLVASQKRERESRLMLGEAVGGFIAHELRQPLAAISLNAYTAQRLGVHGNRELWAVLHDLMADSRRANDIIENTRALFGGAGVEKRPTDLNQLVRDTLLMTSHELRNRHVKVEVELDEHLPLVTVNRMQMQQAFMNLFINAAEAMSDVTERPRQLTIRSSSGDVGLVVRVEDTGPSIQADEQERIFDPLFSAKTHGTGMGLSICRSVVLAHGGSIQMAPRTPFGASFEILLPKEDVLGNAIPAQ